MDALYLFYDRSIPLTLFTTLGVFSLVFAYALHKSKQRLSKWLVSIGMSFSLFLLLVSTVSFLFTLFFGYNS